MSSPERQFRPDVEGLRAVAVGLVVLAHADVRAVQGGYVGVDVFFVLSGFLITGLLLRERTTTGSTSITGFYARRARRILPAATLVLVLTVLASYEWLGFLRGDAVAEDGKWAALFAVNLHLAREGTDYLAMGAPPSPLQHYWSLAVEEQFYLVWPVLFFALARFLPRINVARKLTGALVLVIGASLAWSVIQTGSNPTWAFFSPLTRAWELAAGALLAASSARIRDLPIRIGPWLSWIGLGGVLVAGATFGPTTAFPGYAAGLPVVATALVIAGGTIAPGQGAERLLRLVPFQLLGRWSFSLYLWHWPLLVIAEQHAGETLSVPENLALVLVGLVLAVLTHYAVENPVRYARPLAKRSWSSVSVGASLVFVAFMFCAWQLRDSSDGSASAAEAAASDLRVDVATTLAAVAAPDPDPVGEVLALVAEAQGIESLPAPLRPSLERAAWDFAWLAPWATGCLLAPEEVVSPSCVFGDPNGERTVVLFGDSHAAQWLKTFDDIGRRLNWQVVLFGKAGCPPATLEFKNGYGTGAQRLVGPGPNCPQWLDDTIPRINQLNPDLVVYASCNGCEYMVDDSGTVLSREAWAEGLRLTLDRVTLPAAAQVMLGDIPRWRGPLDCLALHPNNVQSCARPVTDATQTTYNDVEREVAAVAGIPFVDVTPWFCLQICSPVVGDMVVYTNEYHVTSTYARHLGPALQSVLVTLLEGR